MEVERDEGGRRILSTTFKLKSDKCHFCGIDKAEIQSIIEEVRNFAEKELADFGEQNRPASAKQRQLQWSKLEKDFEAIDRSLNVSTVESDLKRFPIPHWNELKEFIGIEDDYPEWRFAIWKGPGDYRNKRLRLDNTCLYRTDEGYEGEAIGTFYEHNLIIEDEKIIEGAVKLLGENFLINSGVITQITDEDYVQLGMCQICGRRSGRCRCGPTETVGTLIHRMKRNFFAEDIGESEPHERDLNVAQEGMKEINKILSNSNALDWLTWKPIREFPISGRSTSDYLKLKVKIRICLICKDRFQGNVS